MINLKLECTVAQAKVLPTNSTARAHLSNSDRDVFEEIVSLYFDGLHDAESSGPFPPALDPRG
jgi:hypothetical protein